MRVTKGDIFKNPSQCCLTMEGWVSSLSDAMISSAGLIFEPDETGMTEGSSLIGDF